MVRKFDLAEVLRAVKSLKPFATPTVVSADAEARYLLQARDRRMFEYLAKPVSARSIYGRICSIMEHNRPFVRAPQYFGPDRRRRHSEFAAEDERRQDAVGVAENEMGPGGYMVDSKSVLCESV
ncbi:MAG: hypothetical protein O3A84_11915 [Proteobacteria bacterium]|nr:hypothetical protein [Pseudomonadota bacterium]